MEKHVYYILKDIPVAKLAKTLENELGTRRDFLVLGHQRNGFIPYNENTISPLILYDGRDPRIKEDFSQGISVRTLDEQYRTDLVPVSGVREMLDAYDLPENITLEDYHKKTEMGLDLAHSIYRGIFLWRIPIDKLLEKNYSNSLSA